LRGKEQLAGEHTASAVGGYGRRFFGEPVGSGMFKRAISSRGVERGSGQGEKKSLGDT